MNSVPTNEIRSALVRAGRSLARLLLATTLLAPGLARPADAAPPAAPAALTLTEAIRLALAGNFTIETSRYDPLIAGANQLEASGAFDPVFRAQYSYSDDRSIAPADPFSGARLPGTVAQADTYQASLGGVLPLGTNYALVASSTNQRGTYNGFANSFYTFGGLRITQPLLRGFGFGANLAGVRVARANRAIADASFRQAVTDIITETIADYNNLYFAQRAYQNAVRSRDLAEGLLRENQRRGEVGNIAAADVTIAEARVARLGDGVLQAERGLRDAQNLLRALLSPDTRPVVDVPLAIAPPESLPFPPIDRAGDLSRALARRPDYQQALQTVSRARAALAETQTRVLPQVDFVGSYGYNGAGGDFDQSYRDVRTHNSPSWSAGAVLSVPLAMREGRGRHRAARLALAQAQTTLRRTEQSIVVEVANAAGLIESNLQRVAATRHARDLAEKSLAAEEKRLQVGQSTTFTVLQFQDLLSAAQIAEDRAIADYNIALASYDRAIGGTLTTHHVTLDEPKRPRS